jgi:glycosyltransferase 2 family protein
LPKGLLLVAEEREGRAWAWLVLKLSIALLAIGAMFYFDMIRLGTVLALFKRPVMVCATAAALLATLPLGAWRWQTLLAAVGVRVGFRQTYHLCAIGMFTGSFLPGVVGGDAVRFLYLNAAVPQHRAVIALSLIADRLLGMTGLIFATAIAVGLQWPIVVASPALSSVALTVVGGSLAALLAAAVLLRLVARLHRIGWLNRLRHGSGPLRLLFGVLEAMLLYRRARWSLVAAFLLSALIQSLSLAALVAVASEMQLDALLDPPRYALAGSLSLLANALPLSPGGLGVGEAAFDQLCRIIGGGAHPAFASIFFAFRGISLAVALVAAPSFIVYRRRAAQPASASGAERTGAGRRLAAPTRSQA